MAVRGGVVLSTRRRQAESTGPCDIRRFREAVVLLLCETLRNSPGEALRDLVHDALLDETPLWLEEPLELRHDGTLRTLREALLRELERPGFRGEHLLWDLLRGEVIFDIPDPENHLLTQHTGDSCFAGFSAIIWIGATYGSSMTAECSDRFSSHCVVGASSAVRLTAE